MLYLTQELCYRYPIVNNIIFFLIFLAFLILPSKPWIPGFIKRFGKNIIIALKWYLQTTALVMWGLICACTPLKMPTSAKNILYKNINTFLMWYLKSIWNGIKGVVMSIYSHLRHHFSKSISIILELVLFLIII